MEGQIFANWRKHILLSLKALPLYAAHTHQFLYFSFPKVVNQSTPRPAGFLSILIDQKVDERLDEGFSKGFSAKTWDLTWTLVVMVPGTEEALPAEGMACTVQSRLPELALGLPCLGHSCFSFLCVCLVI